MVSEHTDIKSFEKYVQLIMLINVPLIKIRNFIISKGENS